MTQTPPWLGLGNASPSVLTESIAARAASDGSTVMLLNRRSVPEYRVHRLRSGATGRVSGRLSSCSTYGTTGTALRAHPQVRRGVAAATYPVRGS